MIYNCFVSPDRDFSSLGNPSYVFFTENNETENDMRALAIEAKTPISCFITLNVEYPHAASVKFFAPNGKKEIFCGHGLISVAKALKDKGHTTVKNILTESGTIVDLKVLESGASSIQIPTKGFDISSFEDFTVIKEISDLFSLKDEIVEVFKAGTLGDLLFELNCSSALRNLKFEKTKVADFFAKTNLRAIMFFCKDSNFNNVDSEIRVFYSNLELLEDVACGSVNISVARVLYNKYGITNYKAVQPYNYQETGKIGGHQEVCYDPNKEMLILNGFTELATNSN